MSNDNKDINLFSAHTATEIQKSEKIVEQIMLDAISIVSNIKSNFNTKSDRDIEVAIGKILSGKLGLQVDVHDRLGKGELLIAYKTYDQLNVLCRLLTKSANINYVQNYKYDKETAYYTLKNILSDALITKVDISQSVPGEMRVTYETYNKLDALCRLLVP